MNTFVGDRDQLLLAVLECLARAPFLRVEDLALELGTSRGQMYALVRSLLASGYIECLSRMARVYLLSSAGRAALRQQMPQLDSLERFWGMKEHRLPRLLPRVDQLLLGHMVLHSLMTHAPEAFGEQGKSAQVRWHWIRDYEQSLSPPRPGASPLRLFADWLLLFFVKKPGQTQEVVYPLFLLLDHECLPQRQIRQRLAYFLKARQLAGERESRAFQQFPLIVILLSGKHRARHWQRWSSELTIQEHQATPLRACLMVLPGGEFTGGAANERARKREKRFFQLSFDIWKLQPQMLQPYGPAEPLRSLIQAYPEDLLPSLWRAPSHHGLLVAGALEEEKEGKQADLLPSAPQKGERARLRGRLSQAIQYLQPDHLDGNKVGLIGLTIKHNHYRLLELLFLQPLVSRAVLADLLTIKESTVKQYLGILHPLGCVEIEILPGEDVTRWRLSSQGIRLLALRYHLSPLHIAALQADHATGQPFYVQRGLEALRREIKKTSGVYAFIGRLIRDQSPTGKLLWWETAYVPDQEFYRLSQEAWHVLKTDAIGEYQHIGQKRIRFWLEWVEHWERHSHISDVFAHYAAYIRSLEWRREGHRLPVLLLVCPDVMRERQIHHLAREALGLLRPEPIIFSTTVERVQQVGPAAPIWQMLSFSSADVPIARRFFYDMRTEQALQKNNNKSYNG